MCKQWSAKVSILPGTKCEGVSSGVQQGRVRAPSLPGTESQRGNQITINRTEGKGGAKEVRGRPVSIKGTRNACVVGVEMGQRG